jgi:hypothetical protein
MTKNLTFARIKAENVKQKNGHRWEYNIKMCHDETWRDATNGLNCVIIRSIGGLL